MLFVEYIQPENREKKAIDVKKCSSFFTKKTYGEKADYFDLIFFYVDRDPVHVHFKTEELIDKAFDTIMEAIQNNKTHCKIILSDD